MGEFQIICKVHDEKKRITHVRLTSDGLKFTIGSIISLMNGNKFFTKENGRQVEVVHRKHPTTGREYLTTKPDDFNENNLDFLPDCGPFVVPPIRETNINYTIPHVYVDTRNNLLRIVREANTTQIIFRSSGDLPIRHPGSLRIRKFGSYVIRNIKEPKLNPDEKEIPVTVRIYSPDGNEFTASKVTVDDLNRFRDLRGVSQGTWRYTASGSGEVIDVEDPEFVVAPHRSHLLIAIDETLRSQSAGPLVDREVTSVGTEEYSFALYRVGQFVANVSSRVLNRWKGTLQLRDPNGAVVASSPTRNLRFPVTLRTLDQSRDAAGQIRKWSLEIQTTRRGSGSKIRATVISTLRIPVAVIQDRIDELIGVNGSKISIYGENKDGRALGRIMILDQYTAETVDMRGLLDRVLENVNQDPGVDVEHIRIEKDVAYNFVNINESIGLGFSVDISSFEVDALKIAIGASQHINPVVPAVTVRLDVQGGINFNFSAPAIGTVRVGTISLRGDSISLEVGVKMNDAGELVTVSWMTDDPLDIDISTAAWVTISPFVGGFATLAALKIWIQHTVNDLIIEKFRSIVEDAIFHFPRILVMLLGASFTLTSLRMDGDTIVIDYVSPVEPEPKPNEIYTGIIGRSVQKHPVRGWQISPPTLGDTWAADNLRNKIQHIVVVMMENRSFDHVLGYRAALPDAQDENGLTDELIEFLGTQMFEVLPLRDVDRIIENTAGLRTRFPIDVGHSFTDVAEQLSQRLQTQSGLMINSPQGFVDDFEPRIEKMPEPKLVKNDVLGYYTGEDLKFYDFLARNYAYSQLYFSSHPGPTLPNRMYWLAGNVQYDRTGEAIINNNKSDNLLLSRALNIFDVLERKNISWRVYESFPSVAMLRMFARYAADNTHIVDIEGLERDIADDNLPSVTFIEPKMHTAPPNDDHPNADMLFGQHFIKRVYDALRLKEAIWRNTLLIITYDEHGGFYDHVIPPVADAFSKPPVVLPTDELTLDTTFKKDMTIPYGVRVPTFVVSPWVPPGKGPDIVLDHCSIIKTILARFCGNDRPFLSDRVDASLSFESFLTLSEPRLNEVPPSPNLPAPFSPGRRSIGTRAIITKPVTRKDLDEGTADFHEITGMLARMLGRH